MTESPTREQVSARGRKSAGLEETEEQWRKGEAGEKGERGRAKRGEKRKTR